MSTQPRLLPLACLALWLLLVGPALWRDRGVLSGERRGIAGRWDPRGREQVQKILQTREREAFLSRLHSSSTEWIWPGLRSVQSDVAWLEILQGLHNDASFAGDFSWFFGRLDFIARVSPHEVRRMAQLAPFFFVIGRDGPGATILMHTLIEREPKYFNTWFWAGYHALENLRMRNLASDLYAHAAVLPGAPTYLAALAARLRYGEAWLDARQRQKIMEENMEPELLERLKLARPDFFKETSNK